MAKQTYDRNRPKVVVHIIVKTKLVAILIKTVCINEEKAMNSMVANAETKNSAITKRNFFSVDQSNVSSSSLIFPRFSSLVSDIVCKLLLTGYLKTLYTQKFICQPR
ncbi:MAG: hypothetical protein Q8R36_03360 [bacterium]|nr:hypothetical protein [bacterium]